MQTNSQTYQTRPDDRISVGQKITYGAGQISNIMLAVAIASIAPFVLTVELGVNAGLVELALALPRIWDTQWEIFNDGVHGARMLAIFLGLIIVGITTAVTVFLKDPTKQKYQKRSASDPIEKSGLPFFKGIRVTLSRRRFRCLCFATLAFFPGLLLVQNFGSFLVIYHVYGGDKAAASVLLGWGGMLSSILGIVFIPLVTYLGTHLGKNRAFILCASLALFGTLIKWFCYQPTMPYVNLIPGPYFGIGYAALWVLMGSMIADVCDKDECETGERREGTYSSIFWWGVKLGMSASLAMAGFILNFTGFQEGLIGPQSIATIFNMRVLDVLMPAICIILSIVFMIKYPLSEVRSHEIRNRLDKLTKAKAASPQHP